MKLLKMKIENYKGISQREYDLSPTIIAILGDNGYGKTSLLDAYNSVFTGMIKDQDVRTGAKSAKIEAEFDSGAEIIHVRKTKKMVKTPVTDHHLNKVKKSLEEVRLYLERHYDSNPETLAVLSSSTMLQEMAPADLSQFLLKHLACKATGAELIGMLQDEEVNKSKIFEKYIKEEEEYDADGIARIYEMIANDRLLCGRDVKSYRSYIDNYSGYVPNPGRTVEFLDQEIEKLMRESAAAEEAKNAYLKRKKLIESTQKSIERMQTVKEEFNQYKDVIKPDGSDQKIQEDLQKLEKEIRLLQDNIVKANKDIEFYEKILANIENGKCPIYEQMRCGTDWSSFKKEFASHIAGSQQIKKKNMDVKAVKEAEKQNLQKSLTAYQKNAVKYERKSQLYMEYMNLKDSIPKKGDMEEKEIHLPDLNELKTTLTALKKEKKMLEEYEAYQKKLKLLSEAENQYAILDALCKELNPKGTVISTFLNAHLKQMETLCQETAKTFRQGFEIKLYMDKGLHVYCRPRLGMPLVEYKNASSGEKACIMVSLVDMINKMTKNRILALDDIEKLDTEMLNAVLQLITDPLFKERYDNIILAGVGHQDTMDMCRKYGITLL